MIGLEIDEEIGAKREREIGCYGLEREGDIKRDIGG